MNSILTKSLGFEKVVSNKITLVLLAGLALGSSAVMTRLGVTEFPPLVLVVLRLALSSLIFGLALAILRRNLRLGRQAYLDIALVGLLNTGFPLLVWTLALQHISSGVLTIFFTLIPVFTGLLAHLLLEQEQLSRLRLAGLLLAMAGTLLLVLTGTSGLSTSQGAQGFAAAWRGHLLALAGVISTSFGLIVARRRLQRFDVLVVTAGQVSASVLVLAPVAALLADFSLAGVTWKGWTALGYSSLVGSFLGFLLLFQIIKQYGASNASLPGYVVPVISTFLGALLLDEIITLPLVSGAILVLLGVFWASR